MSLKFRLTLFYTAIAGGLLLLLSAGIYGLVTLTLIGQLDEELEEAWGLVRQVTRVSSQGELETIADLSLNQNIFVQAWDRNGELKATSFSVNQLAEPLSQEHLNTSAPVFADSRVAGAHLRVLSVPVLVGERSFGTLQIATDMGFVDRAQSDLLRLIGVSVAIGIVFAAILTWISTQSALATLENARDAALLIMETNDLSRRIPQPRRASGLEVEQLVTAFNQNLSRIERLLETQRRFLADVGHELRTPLTVIKGNVGLMQRMKTFDEEALGGISDEVDRLTRLVGDLVLLAQAESGKLPMGWDPIDLDTVVLDVFRQMAILSEQKALRFKLGEIEPVIVCGDRDRLTQVIVNLVSNSIKYTQPGGQVILSLRSEKTDTYITVADNGPGIPESDLPYIFERFYRAEKSRQRSMDGKGFGLGLSIAYYIVNGHDGNIEVESKEGVGTTFTVRLPISSGECVQEGE
ncbi:MAG TPA: HAMP domain-containing sensor histidine kinase [Anaerolineales bacterium]|nr:HAMP domain-containing sensor histidine kinase [Anaerolineales bacterium]